MESIYIQMNRYVLPAIILFGTVGSLLNQALFYFRKPLRLTSCALYFRSLSVNDLGVLYLVILPQWLNEQFQINPMVQYQWYCKLMTYYTFTLYSISPYYLVLACFDRLCTSSTNVKLRRIATVRVASFLTPCMAACVFGFYTYVLVWCQIVYTPHSSFCAIIHPVYSQLLVYSILFLFCFLPPSLMIIFCSITLILLRQQRRRVMPVNQARLRHRDNQLLKMLVIYVTLNIICTVPFTVTYFIAIYINNNPSPFNDILVESVTMLTNVNYATSFYIYTLGTPFYRDELWNLVKSIWQRFHPVDNTNHE